MWWLREVHKVHVTVSATFDSRNHFVKFDSFCNNEFLAGMPVELMKISGHRSLKDFFRYIKVTPDQAAFHIEKIWRERELVTAAQPVG